MKMTIFLINLLSLAASLVDPCFASIRTETLPTKILPPPPPPTSSSISTTMSTLPVTKNVTTPIKCCVLCEPSPLTYVSGYANRFQELLKYLKHNGDEVHLITTEVVASDRPQHFLNFPVHYTRGFRLPLYRSMTISLDWTLRTLRVIHREKPDLIHASSPGFMVIAAFFYSRLYSIPLVVSYHTHLPVYVHSYVPSFCKSLAERACWIVLKMMSLADLTLFTSKEIQQQFLDRRVVTRCDVWQKGIDTDRFHPRNKNMTMRHRMSNGHVNDFLLLYVGRIAKEKRLQDLYGILEDLQKNNKDPDVNYRLCFVGDGPYKDELQNEVFRDNENVVFLGELHGEELASTFASADCFVFPSDSETLGFVVLEALASGLPCVAARGGGVPSLIEHEETSFLCIPGNVTDFARRIQQLTNDPQLGQTMAEKARLETTKFNWHASMAKLRHIQYEQAFAQYELRSGVRFKRFIYRTWTRIRHHKDSSM